MAFEREARLCSIAHLMAPHFVFDNELLAPNVREYWPYGHVLLKLLTFLEACIWAMSNVPGLDSAVQPRSSEEIQSSIFWPTWLYAICLSSYLFLFSKLKSWNAVTLWEFSLLKKGPFCCCIDHSQTLLQRGSGLQSLINLLQQWRSWMKIVYL